MNFKKLQAMQAKLDEAILADKAPMTAEERFNKTLVALSVEIAEVANCEEHFKFWKDKKGKIDSKRFTYNGLTNFSDSHLWTDENSGVSNYTFEQAHHLTLIEECSVHLNILRLVLGGVLVQKYNY